MKKYIILALACAACNMRKVDTTKMKEKMKNYIIKQATAKDISSQIEVLGMDLEKTINHENTCQHEGISFLAINANTNEYTGKTKEVIEAYQYAMSQKQAIESNIQKLSDSSYLYTFPLDSASFHFKNCRHQIGIKVYNLREVLRSL